MASSTQDQQEHQYVDFDEYVEYQLTKVRSQVRWHDLFFAIVSMLAFGVAYLLFFVIADQWLIPGGLPQIVRMGMLLLFLGSVGYWLRKRIWQPYQKQISELYAAHVIEESVPGLKDRLLNMIAIRNAGRETSPAIKKSIEKQTAVRLAKANLEHVVDSQPLIRMAFILLALVILFGIYAVLTPKDIFPSFYRAIFPPANVAVATETEIVNIQPGNTSVFKYSNLDVSVELKNSGQIPEEVVLYYSTANGVYTDVPLVLNRNQEKSLPVYESKLVGVNGRGIEQELTYWIQAGDARSDLFRIGVQHPPEVNLSQLTIEYPKYMKLPVKQQKKGDLDEWEGSRVHLKATANMEIRDPAYIEFSDDETFKVKGEQFPLKVSNGTDISGNWLMKLRTDRSFPQFYRIRCHTEGGDTNTDTLAFHYKVRPDEKPLIRLVSPSEDTEHPANAIVPILFEAADPDFLLSSVRIHISKKGEEIFSETITEKSQKSLSARYRLHLERLGVQTGEVIQFWLEAEDNRQPQHNHSRTSSLRITIVDPVSRQEQREQLEQNEQKQDDLQKQREQNQQQQNQEQQQRNEKDQQEQREGDPQQQSDEQQPSEEGKSGEQSEGQSGENGKGESGKQEGANQTESDNEGADGQQQESSESGQTGDERQNDPQQQEGDREGGARSDNQTQQESGGDQQQESLDPDNAEDQEKILEKLKEYVDKQQEEQSAQDQDRAQEQPSDQQTNEANEQPSDQDQSSENEEGSQEKRGNEEPSAQEEKSAQEQREKAGSQTEAGEKQDDAQSEPSGKKDPGRNNETGSEEQQPAEKEPGEEPKQKQNQSSETDPQSGQESEDKQNSQQQQSQGEQNSEEAPSGSEQQQSDQGQSQQGKQEQGSRKEGQSQPNGQQSDQQQPGEKQSGEKESGQKSEQQGADQESDADGAESQQKTSEKQEGDEQQNSKSSGKEEDASRKESSDNPPQEPSSQKSEQPSEQKGEGQGKGEQNGQGQKQQQQGQNEKGEPQQGMNQQGKGGQQQSSNQDGQKQQSDQNKNQQKAGGEKSEQTNGDGEKGSGEDVNPFSKKENQPGDETQENSEGQQKESSETDQNQQKGSDSNGQKQQAEGGQDQQQGAAENGDAASEQENSGQQAGNQKQSQSKQQSESNPAGGKSNGGGASQNPAASSGSSSSSTPAEQEDANEKYAREAGELILKQLEKQIKRGEIDEELLKELGWTEGKLKQFHERLKKQLSQTAPESPREEAANRQFMETLKSLNLRSTGRSVKGDTRKNVDVTGTATSRKTVPERYRKRSDALKKTRAGKSD